MSILTDRKDTYKTAPTFLHNLEGEAKLFGTQEEVDKAWDEGWFGPPWAVESKGAISAVEAEFETKADLRAEIEDDPRYDGVTLNFTRARSEVLEKLILFEIEEGILEA